MSHFHRVGLLRMLSRQTDSRPFSTGLSMSHRAQGQVVGESFTFSIIFIIAIFSNILMMIAVVKPKPPLTSTRVLLANLVVAELLFTLGLPLVITTRVTREWLIGEPLCKMLSYFAFVCSMSYLLTLTLISCDRFLRVWQGGRCRLSRRTTFTIIGIIWVVASTLSIPVVMSQRTLRIQIGNDDFDECLATLSPDCQTFCHERTFCGVVWSSHFEPHSYLICITTIFFIFPLTIICVVYAKIYHQVRQSSRRLKQHSGREGVSRNQTSDSMRFRHQTRLAKMVLVIVSSFVFMWLPFFVLGTIAQSSNNISSTAFVLSLMLAYTNAGVNPFIYGYFNPGFQQQFQAFVQACRLRFASSACPNLRCPYRIQERAETASSVGTERPPQTGYTESDYDVDRQAKQT